MQVRCPVVCIATNTHLVSDELVVDAIGRHQFVVCPKLMHDTVLQSVNEVRILDGRQTVSNNNRCPTLASLHYKKFQLLTSKSVEPQPV